MTKIELKSLENDSIIRKFTVLFCLTSLFPLGILTALYFFMNESQINIDSRLFFAGVYLVAIFALIGFLYMRQTLNNLRKLSQGFSEALKNGHLKRIDLKIKGDNEVTAIANSFNQLVNRLESNIDVIEKSQHLLSQALDHEQVLSRTDPLTDIANRRVFYEMADMEINKARRYGHVFTALLIDVDNFKEINDARGHEAGDLVLRAVAKVLKENLRATDIAARVGGDEFSVILSETGTDALGAVVPRLQQKLLDAMAESGWQVTFSIGVVTFQKAPENIDGMMKKIDSVMYEVKRSGKNNIRYAVA